MPKNKSIIRQVQETLEHKLRIGESKHLAKEQGVASEGIYSWSTYKNYLAKSCAFVKLAKEQHGCRTLDDARSYVDSYLQKHIDEKYSPYTQKLIACALAKVYGCSTTDFIPTETRHRANITRSRMGKAVFCEKKNREFVDFCKTTGLRRSEIEYLEPEHLYYDKAAGKYFMMDVKGKGGCLRDFPILSKEAVERIQNTPAGQKIWETVPSRADIHSLIVDPYAASIVKRIFEMRLQKLSHGAIARILNEEGIISPSGYRAEKHGIPNKHTNVSKWGNTVVISVINNPVCFGAVAHSRVGCASYKNQRQQRKPMEDWIIAEDMHEPIISREGWQKCQELRKEHKHIRRTAAGDTAPFTGLMKCIDCGYNLVRTGNYYILASGEKVLLFAYNCGTYVQKGRTACTSHYILERDLKDLVIADIREKAGEVLQDEGAARERYYTVKSQSSGIKLNTDRNALKKLNKRLGELDTLIQAAFEKSVLSGAPSEMFTTLAQKYEAEKQGLAKQAQQLTTSIEQQSQTENDVETFIALMKKHVKISGLDRATAAELIDHITVSASTVEQRDCNIL